MARQVLVCALGVPALAGLAEAIGAGGTPCRFVAGAHAAVEAIGAARPDLIVATVTPDDAASAVPLARLSREEWLARTDDGIFDLFDLLRAMREALGNDPCVIVLAGPSLGLTGARDHTALATLAEGQRGLMKTLARQWAPQLRFAWLALWPPLLVPGFDEALLPEQPELGPYTPPLGARPGWAQAAEAALALGELARCATGQTMLLDGGEWMLP